MLRTVLKDLELLFLFMPFVTAVVITVSPFSSRQPQELLPGEILAVPAGSAWLGWVTQSGHPDLQVFQVGSPGLD